MSLIEILMPSRFQDAWVMVDVRGQVLLRSKGSLRLTLRPWRIRLRMQSEELYKAGFLSKLDNCSAFGRHNAYNEISFDALKVCLHKGDIVEEHHVFIKLFYRKLWTLPQKMHVTDHFVHHLIHRTHVNDTRKEGNVKLAQFLIQNLFLFYSIL